MTDISEDIIIQASEGDVEAFEVIYKAYSGFVYNVAYRVVRHPQDAQEVTQDVFITIYRKLKSFEFRSSLKTWIYRMTVNLSINYAKKRSKTKDRMVEFYPNIEAKQTGGRTYEQINKEDQEQMISGLLKALNPDQRACVVLRSIEGLSYDEIADTLKININTVRSRLKRAREKLLLLKKEVVNHEL